MPARIFISVHKQRLRHYDERDELLGEYPISTAENGVGFEEGSYRTPIGRFQIAEMIGQGAAPMTIFKGRKPIGTHDPAQPSSEDLITSRIIWLDGIQEMNANTKQRYIYIHGTNHESRIGQPCSMGCVRMLNQDIIELYDALAPDTLIMITP
ncbi:L,D-transpeptidase [Rubritalea marina]|uniref:L,D-transpeptidase n=1 Tax=Rubritalea marina TaxID=361055 RepID=UPI0003787BD0|nr:L,D-transpeptidase [Rubritalea marina]